MGTKIGLLFIKLLGHLPFGMLYFISDCSYLLILLLGYRRKVVMTNLKNSFPEKSEKELKEIARKYYRHMCDIFFETFKQQSMTEAEMKEHVQVENIELVNRYYDEGRDVIAVLAHYGNWEWVPSINLFMKAHGCGIYHKLKSKGFDDFMLKLRSKWGTYNFTMKTSYRSIYKLKMEDKRFLVGVIADQTPSKNKIQYFTKFLNQDTAVHLGAEKMAVKTNSPVVFVRFDKVKRGYYKMIIEPLVENPKGTKEHQITELHTQRLEKLIQEKPEYWLWSHKRWKHKREDVFKA